jgi:hypothetical protein
VTRLFLRDDVDELNLENCLTDQEGQQIRYYLSKHAESPREHAALSNICLQRNLPSSCINLATPKMRLAFIWRVIETVCGRHSICGSLKIRRCASLWRCLRYLNVAVLAKELGDDVRAMSMYDSLQI